MAIQCTGALVTLASEDLETLVRFYSKLLGQAPISQIPNVYAEFQLPGLRLGIFKPKVNNQKEFNSGDRMSLCLETKDLELAIAHLTSLGYPPPGEILTASHGREIYAYDPEGNCLILHEFR